MLPVTTPVRTRSERCPADSPRRPQCRRGLRCWHGGERLAGARPHRRRTRLRRAGRPAPARAAGALLPDAGLAHRRGGHPAGDAAVGLARPAGFRGQVLGAVLAVPHRDQPVPERAAGGRPAHPGRAAATVSAARADQPRRDHLAPAVPGRPAGRRPARRGGARGPVSGQGSDRAGVRRRTAAAAAAAGRRTGVLRCARLYRCRGGHFAGNHPDRRQGGAATRADDDRAGCSHGRAPAGRGNRARTGPAVRRRLPRRRHRRPDLAADRRRPAVHAARAAPVPGPGRDPRVPAGQLRLPRCAPRVPAARPRERAASPGQLPGRRPRRPRVRPACSCWA